MVGTAGVRHSASAEDHGVSFEEHTKLDFRQYIQFNLNKMKQECIFIYMDNESKLATIKQNIWREGKACSENDGKGVAGFRCSLLDCHIVSWAFQLCGTYGSKLGCKTSKSTPEQQKESIRSLFCLFFFTRSQHVGDTPLQKRFLWMWWSAILTYCTRLCCRCTSRQKSNAAMYLTTKVPLQHENLPKISTNLHTILKNYKSGYLTETLILSQPIVFLISWRDKNDLRICGPSAL